MHEHGKILQRIQANIETVFLGKPEAVRFALIGLLGGGHVLIEDAPGVGKTLLAMALARSVDCTFKRIQFTADMLPSDVLGVSVYDPDRKRFEFKPGPVFANIVLADEINRCPPRTQGGLLEAMNELQVTVDGRTYELPSPFLVLATQNPHDLEGTYPLPESERDRFFLRFSLGYPGRADEKRILELQLTTHAVEKLQPVVSVEEAKQLQSAAKQVRLDDSLMEYLLTIVQKTRQSGELAFGVSPRGALMLAAGCRALAMLEGRDFCLPDDVKQLARPILLHRLVHRSETGGTSEVTAAGVLDAILEEVPVPL